MPMLSTVKLTYSIYEAKAKLSAILRLVRQGKRITITDRGREVARVVPIDDEEGVDQRLEDLIAAGVIAPGAASGTEPELVVGPPRPGALDRFLDERD